MEGVDVVDEAVPPVGEEIHLPGGSILPLAVAFGITLTVIGTTIWWVWSLIGFVIFVIATGFWVRDTRHEVDALPEDHHHH
jgi:mannose/fructose/N-acetylgalactosamine-specific phosphotransferase system component IIC